jgi:hypothetical protein
VALSEPVDLSHAHQPANDSEGLLFRNLYPNLIRLDCEGEILPDLAESWQKEGNGRSWTFTLRENAGSTSTEAFTPARIVESVAAAIRESRAPGLDSVHPIGQRQLRVHVTPPSDTPPVILADPSLAIIGGAPAAGPSGIVLPAIERFPVIELKFPLNLDGRDALDRGADLIVTRDPALIDYASGRSSFESFPLPWNRTYLLLQPAGAQPIEVGKTEEERRSLAQDAVQVEARAAEPVDWLGVGTACSRPAVATPSRQPRLAYVEGDEVAQALAGRLVALADPDLSLRSIGLEPAAFEASLRQGTELAYIHAVPRRSLDPCRELAGLASGMSALPLIDTRSRAIIRKGSPPLTVDWDGAVRVTRP